MFILNVGIQLILSVRVRGKRVRILVGGLLWRCTRVLVRRPVMRWRGLISEFKVGNNLFSASHYTKDWVLRLEKVIVAYCRFAHQKEGGLSFRENETRWLIVNSLIVRPFHDRIDLFLCALQLTVQYRQLWGSGDRAASSLYSWCSSCGSKNILQYIAHI